MLPWSLREQIRLKKSTRLLIRARSPKFNRDGKLPRNATFLWAALAAVMLCGCNEAGVPYDINLTLAASEGVNANVQRIAMYVIGDCDIDLGAKPQGSVFQSALVRGEAPPKLPSLPRGRYGVYAYGVGDDCRPIVAGCTEFDATGGTGAIIEVALSELQSPGVQDCDVGLTCEQAQCVNAGEACLGVADGDPCEGQTGTCHQGVCCSGCWDGVACQQGDTIAACGSEGGACTTCCDSDQCVEGGCDPQQKAISVDVGARHACAVVETDRSVGFGELPYGELYCWGRDDLSQTGVSNHDEAELCDTSGGPQSPCWKLPQRVEAVDGSDGWFAVTAGSHHTCGGTITVDAVEGTVTLANACWGNNNARQAVDSADPVIDVPTVAGSNFFASAGHDHTCGSVVGFGGAIVGFCFGDNRHEQLGYADGAPDPFVRAGGAAEPWTSLRAGTHFSCGNFDGTLYCWGRNQFEQVGSMGAGDRPPTAVDLGTFTKLGDYALGGEFACAIRDQQAWCWGNNEDGQLGRGSTGSILAPAAIFDGRREDGTDQSLPLVSIGAGDNHACGVTAEGELYCWGFSNSGEVGPAVPFGTATSQPVQVSGQDWAEVAASHINTCALKTDGSLWCWGNNRFGQLGIDSVASKNVPQRVCF